MKEKNKYPIYDVFYDKDEYLETSVRYYHFFSDDNFVLHKKFEVLRIEVFNTGEYRTEKHDMNNNTIEIWENLRNFGRYVEIKHKED